MAICPCCCTNRLPDGQLCICAEYTQIVIEVPGLSGPEGGGCGCTGGVIVADFVNELQEFGVDKCRPPGDIFPDYVAKYTVLPTTCAFYDCKHLGPGFGGSLQYKLTPASNWLTASQFQGIAPAGETGESGGGFESQVNEPCGEFAARYNYDVSETPGVFTSCSPTVGGGWSLQ